MHYKRLLSPVCSAHCNFTDCFDMVGVYKLSIYAWSVGPRLLAPESGPTSPSESFPWACLSLWRQAGCDYSTQPRESPLAMGESSSRWSPPRLPRGRFYRGIDRLRKGGRLSGTPVRRPGSRSPAGALSGK